MSMAGGWTLRRAAELVALGVLESFVPSLCTSAHADAILPSTAGWQTGCVARLEAARAGLPSLAAGQVTRGPEEVRYEVELHDGTHFQARVFASRTHDGDGAWGELGTDAAQSWLRFTGAGAARVIAPRSGPHSDEGARFVAAFRRAADECIASGIAPPASHLDGSYTIAGETTLDQCDGRIVLAAHHITIDLAKRSLTADVVDRVYRATGDEADGVRASGSYAGPSSVCGGRAMNEAWNLHPASRAGDLTGELSSSWYLPSPDGSDSGCTRPCTVHFHIHATPVFVRPVSATNAMPFTDDPLKASVLRLKGAVPVETAVLPSARPAARR